MYVLFFFIHAYIYIYIHTRTYVKSSTTSNSQRMPEPTYLWQDRNSWLNDKEITLSGKTLGEKKLSLMNQIFNGKIGWSVWFYPKFFLRVLIGLQHTDTFNIYIY